MNLKVRAAGLRCAVACAAALSRWRSSRPSGAPKTLEGNRWRSLGCHAPQGTRRIRLLIRKFATAASAGLLIAALSASATFAADAPGASGCQPAQGQITAAVAQTGALGTIISGMAPINELNQQSLFNCRQP
jgi:hypothetical protein